MNALSSLTAALRPATDEGAKPFLASTAIDDVLAQMQRSRRDHKPAEIADSLQLEAVRRFWASKEVQSFRDAFVLSSALCLPIRSGAECVLEDKPRLDALLNGVDVWAATPKTYRRCYQGLVKSYFTYDGIGGDQTTPGRQNWRYLRGYLNERNRTVESPGINPDWVGYVTAHRHLFTDAPCIPYVAEMLKGDRSQVDRVCEHLGIAKTSWFLRELVLAQVVGATKLEDAPFQELMPRLLELLAANEFLRDRGLVLILDRYSKIRGSHLNQTLRDAAVSWWGNPWLPSNESRWGGVREEARAMVADWLKLEFIETFFTKLAEDGLGDPRRMDFWKRYVKAINHIEFALGSTARNSRERDMVVLRKKMTGLVRELDASGTNNAFIMRMGNLVAVEFSGMGNALYGYDARKHVPFDTNLPLTLPTTGANSLKQRSQSILWMQHQDGIHGWNKWEHMFEATLKKEFDLQPETAPSAKGMTSRSAASKQVATPVPPPPVAAPAKEPSPPAFETAGDGTSRSRSADEVLIRRFAASQGLKVDDKSGQGGNLWVITTKDDSRVADRLTELGMKYRPGKGWWR